MTTYINVSEAVRELGEQLNVDVPPRILSDLFFQRRLDVRRCPVLGGRRLIPRDYLPVIRDALLRSGLVTPGSKESPDHDRPPQGTSDPAV
jgi:hypothetical protein